ncbi:MAG: NDP-sugar synthase [Acidobacteria bacterium]|nr:NDP-sugar synthase [Acidobacteriota bacterium]
MKAMILAAGFGTRLWPLTEDRTKPAIPFLNRPLIAYAIEYLAEANIRDLIINLHHQPDSIRNALGDGSQFGAHIHYSFEEEILGTSGAIDKVRDLLMDDDFIVINGKIVTNIDVSAAIREHQERQALATLVLKENLAREHFSIVEIDERQYISRFAGFPKPLANEIASAEGQSLNIAVAPDEPPPLMFVGIQVLSPRIFDYVPRHCFSHSVVDVYPKAMAAGEAIIAHLTRGDWYELSTIERYVESSLHFMRQKGLANMVGANCRVMDGATVEDAILWDNVTIERGATVRHAVLADNVRIPAGARIERAVVVRRDIVKEIERGEIVGENLLIQL